MSLPALLNYALPPPLSLNKFQHLKHLRPPKLPHPPPAPHTLRTLARSSMCDTHAKRGAFAELVVNISLWIAAGKGMRKGEVVAHNV